MPSLSQGQASTDGLREAEPICEPWVTCIECSCAAYTASNPKWSSSVADGFTLAVSARLMLVTHRRCS